jgi:hypothetical protein
MPMKGAPNSLFKTLFIGACLGAALRRMSHLKAVRDGIKPKCKRMWVNVNFPFHTYPRRISFRRCWIPDTGANTLKLILPQKVELQVLVWSQGTHEQFLVHVQQALDAIRQKDILMAYEKAYKEQEECPIKLSKTNEALVNYKRQGANPSKVKGVQKVTETRTSANKP